MVPSLSLAQGKGREGNGGLDHVYDSHSWCPFLLPTLPLPESHGWLIMEQSCCPLICVCHMSCSKPPSVMVNHLRQSNWSTRSLCPLALPCQCQCWIHRLPRESKERAGKTLLSSPLPLPWSSQRSSLHGWPCLRLFALNWVAHSATGPGGHLCVTSYD